MSHRGLYHNLEPRRNAWYVWLDVPPSLREMLGRRRLRKTTGTDNKQLALLRRGPILQELRMMVEKARRQSGTGGGLSGEALGWRRDLSADLDPHDRASLEIAVVDRAEQLEPVLGFAAANAFADMAFGHATPLTHHLDEWLAQTTYKDRQKSDVRNSFAKLAAWLASRDLVATIEAVTDRVASTYKAEAMVNAGMHPKTANKLMSFLRVHWTWLKSHGYFDGPNPWEGKSLKKPKPSADDLERPFTDDEIVLLFNGPADEPMRDLMATGALSGMRLEEIYQLQAKHCRDDVLRIVTGKTAAARRDVPIHPKLAPVIKRRLKGKGDEDYLFEGETKGRDGSRSSSVSKRFKTYRKGCGVDEMLDGKRRSLVNFHSFRRWFITKADQARCRKEDIERVVGHKPEGQSLGVYSGGITLEQRRAVVEAVRLPNGIRKRLA